jgi:hypothetical protein
MNYYYDPILGLQYNFLPDFFIINIDAIPKLNNEDWLKLLEETCVFPTEPFPGNSVEYIFKITDYRL